MTIIYKYALPSVLCLALWLLSTSAQAEDSDGVEVLGEGNGSEHLGIPARVQRDTVLTVRDGDTLLRIADRLLEKTDYYTRFQFVDAMRRANALEDDVLRPGQNLLVSLSDGIVDSPQQIPTMENVRGIYVNATVAGSARILKLTSELKKVGGNTVVFDIKDRPGDLSYASKIPLARRIEADASAPIDRPQRLVDRLHAEGIYVVARLTCFYDERLAQKCPDLAPKSLETGTPWLQRGKLRWVDPGLPAVQEYLLAIVDEVAGLGVDEIQLDYVRFPTEGNVEDAVFSSAGSASKDRVITDFLRQVHDRLEGSEIRLSADVFGIVAWGREADKLATGQSVRDMLEYVDVVSPMLYPSHFYGSFEGMEIPSAYPYYFLYQGCLSLRRQAEHHGVVVRPWIQAFPYRVADFDSDYIVEQIRGADDGGARGWLLWNSSMHYGLGLEAIDTVVNGPMETPSGTATSGRWKRTPDPQPEQGVGSVQEQEGAAKNDRLPDAIPEGQDHDPEAEAPASQAERAPASEDSVPHTDSVSLPAVSEN